MSKTRWLRGVIPDSKEASLEDPDAEMQPSLRLQLLRMARPLNPECWLITTVQITTSQHVCNSFSYFPKAQFQAEVCLPCTHGTASLSWTPIWEHYMDHLERFKDLVSAIKVNGVPDDYLLWNFFKYLLARYASYWLKQLPPRSLTS